MTATVTFRPLLRSDLRLLATWLAEPLVARWWNHEFTAEAVERDFGASIDGAEPTDVFVASADGVPFGLIQRYLIGAYPGYEAELAPVCVVPPGALSVDYLVGEPALRGRGLGAAMVAGLVERSWSSHPGSADVLVPVAAGNVASWRLLERAGFRRYAEGQLEPDNPVDSADHYVYRLRRPGDAVRERAGTGADDDAAAAAPRAYSDPTERA